MHGFKKYIELNEQMKHEGKMRLDERQQFGKSLLYPLGYGGIGNYPPSYMTPSQADAITYLTDDARLWAIWEKKPFPIHHLKPNPIPPKEPKLKGKIIPWKDHKKFLANGMVGIESDMPPGDVIPWNTKDCLPCTVKAPETLDPRLCGKKAEDSVCKHMWKMPPY